jgi:hypothetical protein
MIAILTGRRWNINALWSAFPWWLKKLNIFSCVIGLLYFFFRELSVQFMCPLIDWIICCFDISFFWVLCIFCRSVPCRMMDLHHLWPKYLRTTYLLWLTVSELSVIMAGRALCSSHYGSQDIERKVHSFLYQLCVFGELFNIYILTFLVHK